MTSQLSQTRPLPVAMNWSDHDQHRSLTFVAVGGLLLAAAFAVLGLPPYDIHGPLHHLGVMMPTCGATRATRYAAQGQWATSWQYNPLGPILVLGAAGALARAVLGVLSGRWATFHVHRSRWLLAAALFATAALELNQQLHAQLLMGP